jgi:hypothetical protein
MTDKQFIGEIFRIAFGLGASNRGFSREEVIERLRNYSDFARAYGNGEPIEETEQ